MAFHRILQFYLLRYALFIATVRTEEVFNTTPPTVKTNFSCFNRPMGFYADVEANCRVYHTCDDHGNKFSYRCPEETAFRQDALICDHAHLVDCQAPAYQSAQYSDENADKDKAIRSPIASVDPFDDHRPSFSRFFQVIQQPEKSASNKPGLVFRASLFLREQDRTRNQVGQTAKWNANSKNGLAVSTTRAPIERINNWNPRNNKPNQSPRQSLSSSATRAFARDKSSAYPSRSFAPTSNSSPARTTALPDVIQRSPSPREKSPSSSYNSDYHPYSETLRSIQINAQPTDDKEIPTTEIPVHALTLSLKPLMPNELEYDPYYPKQPTSTEAYYTPSSRNEIDANARLSSSSQAPPIGRLPFEIPSVLPDLNALEDLVDRRKLFYIPRASNKSI
ncbi:uncharacterized protein [Linepithema humile]|uniref:uncharacterized protein n=1 Tax=Linepithema humile TaxID=83485 RepID=UPI0006233633|nr:PREDICTED: uncharacterized protein LOC105667612 [Linepithema humile]